MVEPRPYPRRPSPRPVRAWLTDERFFVGRAVDVRSHDVDLARSKLAPTDTVGPSETHLVEVGPEPRPGGRGRAAARRRCGDAGGVERRGELPLERLPRRRAATPAGATPER